MTEDLPRSLYRIKGTDIVFDPPLNFKNGESLEYTINYHMDGRISISDMKIIRVENIEEATDE